MKLLIVVEKIDNSAAGRVFGSFISQLSESSVEIFIICNKIEVPIRNKINVVELKQPQLTISRKFRSLFVLFNYDFEGYSRVKKGINEFGKLYTDFHPDLVLVFAAAYLFSSIELGFQIGKKYKLPLAIHALDPLPSVPGWGEHPILRKAIIKYVGKRVRHAKYLSYTNADMLEYQLRILGITKATKTAVVYNPGQHSPLESLNEGTIENLFLFVGSMYNRRNPQNLIDAFAEFIKIVPDARLVFIGRIEEMKLSIPKETKDNIVFMNWTDSPEEYMNKAQVLVDIDADIMNDVFISSKLNNYIYFNKLILSISPISSPARKLLSNCKKTTYFSENIPKSIYEQLLQIHNSKILASDFDEREYLRQNFDINFLTSELITSLKQIL